MQSGIRFQQEASAGELQVRAFYRFNKHSFAKHRLRNAQDHAQRPLIADTFPLLRVYLISNKKPLRVSIESCGCGRLSRPEREDIQAPLSAY